MRHCTLTIFRQDVMDEVARTAAYAGAKQSDEAYERIDIVRDDAEKFDRYWAEAKASACTALRQVLASEAEEQGAWSVTLALSSATPEALLPAVHQGLTSFMVLSLLARWYELTNKPDFEPTAAEAAAALEAALVSALYKQAPTRPQH